ncbi:unnamed protein product [Prunus brigantina]
MCLTKKIFPYCQQLATSLSSGQPISLKAILSGPNMRRGQIAHPPSTLSRGEILLEGQ